MSRWRSCSRAMIVAPILPKVLIATRVVAMNVGIDEEANRAIGDLLDGGRKLIAQWRELINPP